VRTRLPKGILYIAVILWSSAAYAGKLYTEVPALVHLSRSEQEDTNGFNLVEYLPGLFYKAINEGKLVLWDSPRKQIAISPSALKNIETSNKISFARVENLFLNELWTSSRRKTEFVIVGFSFLSESPNGKVSIGFIDAVDALPLLSKNYIPTNVNGPAQLTYIDALYSRRYNFNLLQFGVRDFTVNPTSSITIKRDAFYSRKKVSGLVRLPQTKMVTYTLEKNPGQENDPAMDCILSIEKFVNENKEVLFDIGGDKYFDFKKQSSDITITRIEVTEIWEKKGSQIAYKPYQIRIFANNKPLEVLMFSDVAKWDLLINFKTLEDVLIEKAFLFTIYKCNRELIPYDEAGLYLKALKEYKWTQVSNYVKYSRNSTE
jgi:hypothetical protein